MTTNEDWAGYRQWHELLDALCTESGHLDNLALAEALCSASGNHTQSAFDTAVKNLRNWRHGVHIPQRKNLILLGKVLKIDRRPGLREHWNQLYGQARTRADAEPNATAPVWKMPTQIEKPRRQSFVSIFVVVMTIGFAAASIWNWRSGEYGDPVASYEGVVADYVRNVSIKVGETAIIHGARGNDCGPAPAWESAKLLLPDLVTGTLTDGGVGTRVSRQCGGRIPARAILFTAMEPGTEQISLYGDDIVIRVSE